MSEQQDQPSGFAFGLGAYLIWGTVPIFFKLLDHVGAIEIVTHRILWSVPMLVALLAAMGWLGRLIAVARDPKLLATLALSALLIAINWLVFIWAVTHEFILATSLGYFLNPLVNVALGALLLGETMRPATKIAIALAAVGVAILASGALDTLWISLTLAFSFGLYGYVRKIAEVGAIEGLAAETTILAPFCVVYLLWLGASGDVAFGNDSATTALLFAAAAVTSIPLMLFAAAAKRLRLTTLGFIQYLAPSLAFLIGAFLYNEPLGTAQIVCFACIWAGLVIFTIDGFRTARRNRVARRTTAGV